MERNETQPLVSIVLPVYNGEHYLCNSIESVLGQTLTEWELIIVDDCSTDSTPKIAKMYAEMDPRIRVLRNETNQRVPKSLNAGFAEARGDYLTWTSDDNMYLPEALEKMETHLASHPEEAMVVARMSIIDGEGRFVSRSQEYNPKTIFFGNSVGACFMYRRSVWDVLGGYDEEHVYVEDYEHWLRVLEQCGPIGSLPDLLYVYRHHRASITATKQKEIARHLEFMRYKHLRRIVKELKGNVPALHAIYDDFLRRKDFDIAKVQQIMEKALPGISGEKFDFPPGCYIVFGIGKMASEMRKTLGGEVKCFATDDLSQREHLKEGRRIISFQEMLNKLKGGYMLVIAEEVPRVYDIIRQITEAGISEYRTFQGYMRKQEIR